MDTNAIASLIENHGLSLVLMGLLIVLVVIPSAKKLAELVSLSVTFFKQSGELVVALAQGDKERPSLWARMDAIEHRIDERFAEIGSLIVTINEQLSQYESRLRIVEERLDKNPPEVSSTECTSNPIVKS